MAGMYPDNQTIDMFGKKVTWPGVNSKGKFTNGDFNDPDAPPSYIPAETINLVVDNLNTLVTSMGGEPNNTEEEQLATLFSATAVPLSGIKRDEHGRAQVAAPAAPDDIARKADIDGVTETSASHAATRGSNAHGATVSATAGQIITRDASGRAEIEVPTTQKHIANKAYVDNSLPAGLIIASPSSSVPSFLLCHGSNVSRTAYPRLYQAMLDIEFPYGAGDGHSTFTLPNFWGCFLRGAGGNAGGIGTPQGDAIMNITGGFNYLTSDIVSASGAFKIGNSNGEHGVDTGDDMPAYETFFSTSHILGFPTAPENRPVNHAIYWHIKY